ncbi:MAG: hypothetical protein QG622_1904 [Actinomycetota bacterium]|nr:hypothetical protein [Actinomycetota bacterium]
MPENVSRVRLQREWVLCAIAAAASRFVPVPLLDDLIKTRATRTAVSRTWKAHGMPDSPAIGILAEDTTGFFTGLVRSALKLPFLLLFYPIRKIVRIVTAVRGVSADLVDVILLARSIDRCLRSGWFTGTDPDALARQAEILRRAHDQMIGLADVRVLNQAVASALGSVGNLRVYAPAFARRVFGRSSDAVGSVAPAPEPTEQEAAVEQSVREIVALFDRPEVASVLADVDRRFDAALAAFTPAGGARGGSGGGVGGAR